MDKWAEWTEGVLNQRFRRFRLNVLLSYSFIRVDLVFIYVFWVGFVPTGCFLSVKTGERDPSPVKLCFF